MGNIVKTENISIGQGSQLVLISGPCVIENYEITYEIASFLKELTQHLDIPFIFKASYDKANRTSINSFRGPGLADGLDIRNVSRRNLASRSFRMFTGSTKSMMRHGFWTSFKSLLFYVDKPISF
jgi:3-deoxy-D-manno-octulosonic acid (KDO) 8-phosphate synthase